MSWHSLLQILTHRIDWRSIRGGHGCCDKNDCSNMFFVPLGVTAGGAMNENGSATTTRPAASVPSTPDSPAQNQTANANSGQQATGAALANPKSGSASCTWGYRRKRRKSGQEVCCRSSSFLWECSQSCYPLGCDPREVKSHISPRTGT